MERATETAGRGFGKGARLADRAVQDETMGRAGRSTEVRHGATARQRARRTWALWRRRHELSLARPRNTKREAQLVNCPHAVRRWKQVPHPRYGDRVPHFVSWTESLADQPHDCVPGATR